MTSWLDFALQGLATYRLTLMVTKEAGPGWWFKLLRREVKRKAPRATHMDQGISCPFCMSMQIALILSCSHYFLNEYALYQGLIFALALSSVAVIANQLFTKGEL